ncbi:ARID DNA-binding domain-containing protein [Tanacetum coccineum]
MVNNTFIEANWHRKNKYLGHQQHPFPESRLDPAMVELNNALYVSGPLCFFTNFKEEFLVEKLEGQKKLLFTYGMGEIVIKDGSNGYLIPGVHYAPEITLNILSINLLKQQGFDIIFEGDRCTLEYMFKKQKGHNMDVDKMRQRHNDYLDDYFESMDKERTEREGEMPRLVEDTDSSEVYTFHGFVAFLDLIKKDDIISKDWDAYRKIFDKVLIRNKNAIDLLGSPLSSYYNNSPSTKGPMRGGETAKCLEKTSWNIGKIGASNAAEKGKEKLEHFRIKLEEEEDCKQQQSTHYEKEQMTCYKCQDFGHYAFECPTRKGEKDQIKYSSYKEPSTSKFTEGRDSHSISNLVSPTAIPSPKHPFRKLRNMVNTNTFIEANWHRKNKYLGHQQHPFPESVGTAMLIRGGVSGPRYWKVDPYLPNAKQDPAMAELNNALYVSGGYNGAV